ncbi:MAG: GNAT family N-acetyltransferase [Prevotella sp.]|nr:GNAT family N-acetyltransferase [Prevotella sp.]
MTQSLQSLNHQQLPVVRLRALEPEDLDLLYAIENDRELWNIGNTNMPYSRFFLHEYIASVSGDIYTDKQLRLIINNVEGDVVGIVDLVNFNPQHNRAEVGIVICRPYRYEGYGQAVLNQLIQYASDVLHIHQLYAIASVGNEACIRCFEEAGFEREAVLKDWLSDGDTYHDALLMNFFCKKVAKSFEE